ncbi:MAG: hypothetical protein IH823_03740 [Candidatus Dadabacteria bacterium]|nr:hypothetical protein [Candidatus Dadabacteria bacterium]
METTQIYNEPQISDEKCLEISKDLDIVLFNQKTRQGNKLVITQGRKHIDTVYNYTDSRYLQIVKKLEGKVLILGLGMGCNVVRAAERKQVSSVDVLEINNDVIKLFKRIYGVFEGNEKVNIYHDDAMKATWIGKNYDHVFFDTHIMEPQHANRARWHKELKLLQIRYKDSVFHFIKLY